MALDFREMLEQVGFVAPQASSTVVLFAPFKSQVRNPFSQFFFLFQKMESEVQCKGRF